MSGDRSRLRNEEDPILRVKCREVGSNKTVRHAYAKVIKKEFSKLSKCVGLAGPQVGIAERFLIIKTRQGLEVMFNPVVVKTSRIKSTARERCMSFRNRYYVKRPIWAEVEYQTELGEQRIKRYYMKLSRVIQHECDHLDGVCIDKIGRQEGV